VPSRGLSTASSRTRPDLGHHTDEHASEERGGSRSDQPWRLADLTGRPGHQGRHRHAAPGLLARPLSSTFAGLDESPTVQTMQQIWIRCDRENVDAPAQHGSRLILRIVLFQVLQDQVLDATSPAHDPTDQAGLGHITKHGWPTGLDRPPHRQAAIPHDRRASNVRIGRHRVASSRGPSSAPPAELPVVHLDLLMPAGGQDRPCLGRVGRPDDGGGTQPCGTIVGQ
jgi:hypothetical protein